jgi:ribosomal protein S18 acetylase RimI-like enzyme
MEELAMTYLVQEMTVDDYASIRSLWLSSEGILIADSDSQEGIARFLERNPGLSFVARDGDEIVGVVLCGHDGRRGYIDQLAVRRSHRRLGIGRSLVSRCVYNLMRIGIQKWHLFVFEDNPEAIAFWSKLGWAKRVELITMSRQANESSS